MQAALLTHRGSVRVDREALRLIEPPEATRTWKPVKHYELVDQLTQILHANGREIAKEEFAVQRNGDVMFGVMDLKWGQTEEYQASLGLRTSNNKTMSIQIAIGARVCVCDNLLFSGEMIALKRKHTSGLDLTTELRNAVSRYDEGYALMNSNIGLLKDRMLDRKDTEAMLFDIFAKGIMPLKCFKKSTAFFIHYDDDADYEISRWDLLNRLTTHSTKLTPAVRFTTTTNLGKYFCLSDTLEETARKLVYAQF